MKKRLFFNINTDTSKLKEYIVREFLSILNKLECGKEVNYTNLLNAVSLYNALQISDERVECCSPKSILANLPYYLSYYK